MIDQVMAVRDDASWALRAPWLGCELPPVARWSWVKSEAVSWGLGTKNLRPMATRAESDNGQRSWCSPNGRNMTMGLAISARLIGTLPPGDGRNDANDGGE
jgi:hypothetical protein